MCNREQDPEMSLARRHCLRHTESDTERESASQKGNERTEENRGVSDDRERERAMRDKTER